MMGRCGLGDVDSDDGGDDAEDGDDDDCDAGGDDGEDGDDDDCDAAGEDDDGHAGVVVQNAIASSEERDNAKRRTDCPLSKTLVPQLLLLLLLLLSLLLLLLLLQLLLLLLLTVLSLQLYCFDYFHNVSCFYHINKLCHTAISNTATAGIWCATALYISKCRKNNIKCLCMCRIFV